MQNISRSSSSSTSSPSKAIFAQDCHRPSNHCIKTPTRPQAQLKTAQPTRPQAQLFVERRDRDEVLERVRRNGYALKFAAAELRADREIVLEAVKQDGSTLEFAAVELRADRQIVREAVGQYLRALVFAASMRLMLVVWGCGG